jgi:hypothetical protein
MLRVLGHFIFTVILTFLFLAAWNWYSPIPISPEVRPYLVQIVLTTCVLPAAVVALFELILLRN